MRARHRGTANSNGGKASQPLASPAAVLHELPLRQAARFREALLSGILPEDVALIARALVRQAKTGDVAAARLILERVCGTQSLADWPSEAAIGQTERLDRLARGLRF